MFGGVVLTKGQVVWHTCYDVVPMAALGYREVHCTFFRKSKLTAGELLPVISLLSSQPWVVPGVRCTVGTHHWQRQLVFGLELKIVIWLRHMRNSEMWSSSVVCSYYSIVTALFKLLMPSQPTSSPLKPHSGLAFASLKCTSKSLTLGMEKASML